ncbi:MBL fold metallo-hydrolase RNA specificity domain-containing protein [Bradyrhizobium sp. CCBAU 51753]|uniref:MBL fold metallo-hydrolase RNA specificity domain-containing protein n=1 Tax=Bradyrhizobium sp. CCBAU 51753 TaxID=1325100 RepID=UPI00188A16C6|nr:MBL fold metallo-hydrolase [Bradyrhizobium sp. CCBAU 51753]QOZ28511.1 MBL fold metallo-hydrolase [Bradyrhizobium sp. CCBAU 51753]
MKLSFHGADRAVTGSCHLVECLNRRILIDCGLFQGSRDLVEENIAAFRFDPAAIDYVLLTHAHLDHCGRIPLLAKRGFRGEVITTAASRELIRLVLVDAAHLQEEDARRRVRQKRRRGEEDASQPLFTVVDVLDCFDRFGRTAEYGQPLQLAEGLRATFFDAGHILGSASILIEAANHGRTRSVLFSGDLGNTGRPLLRLPSPPARADVVVMESTYGDRRHRSLKDSIEELCGAISSTLARGGNVIIPTFALERAQEILYVLREGVERSRLPPTMQIFLDSPMAISATEIFKRHSESLSSEAASMFREGLDPLRPANLRLVRESADSIAINRITGGAVIMAGSGMCTGGRIRHHLRHNIWRKESAIIFVGYAASGTIARQIIDGARSVRLFGEDVAVRSKIYTINGFSAHADQQELLAWRRMIDGCEATFLVHGEEPAMLGLAAHLERQRVELPRLGDVFDL